MKPCHEKIRLWSKAAIDTLTSTVVFFYGHSLLVLISLIPSTFRAYQMWHHLETPLWIEMTVESTRIILFMLMLAYLSKSNPGRLLEKAFWDRLGHVCSAEMKKNWPQIFIAQLIVFVIVLYGLMNLLIQLIVNVSLDPLLNFLDIGGRDYEASHNALVFFLKNMSVIPLSMVYTLKVFGIGPVEEVGNPE